jgi:hypothetical protein
LACDHFEKVVDQTLPTLEIDRVYNMTEAGQTVMVNVTLRNVPSTIGCFGWQFKLTWDSSVARLTTDGPDSVQPFSGGPSVVLVEGPFLKCAGRTKLIANSVDNDQGEAVLGSVLLDQGKNASGTGVVLMMNFTIVKPGTTAMELSSPTPFFNQSIVADASNRMMDHVDINGWITERKEGPAAYDAIVVMLAFDSTPGSSKWNSEADMNNDNIVDILDAIIVAGNYHARVKVSKQGFSNIDIIWSFSCFDKCEH